MSKEIKLWLTLLVICISLAISFEILPENNNYFRVLCSVVAAILIFITLHFGTKGCNRIKGDRCYTLLFLTCIGFILIDAITLIIGGIYMLCWFWTNNWPAFDSFTTFPWVWGFLLGNVIVAVISACFPLKDKTKMCPDWADDPRKYTDYEEIKWKNFLLNIVGSFSIKKFFTILKQSQLLRLHHFLF